MDETPGILANALVPKPMGKPSTLGVILDVIAGLGGATPTYGLRRAHEQEQQRQDQRLQQQGMLQQQLAAQKWQQEAAFKQAHPDPTNTQRTYEYLKSTMPEIADGYLRSVGMGPPVAVDGVDANNNETRTYVPRSQVYGGAQPRKFNALPPGAVPMGGAAPQANTPFPIPGRRQGR